MEINTRHEFPAAPTDVYAMLTNQAFLERTCQATQALRYEVKVEGTTTSTRRAMQTPPQVAKLVKGDMIIDEVTHWSAPTADGSRTGEISVSSPGLPVKMTGHVTMQPGGLGTVLTYAGELKISIPFLGKSLESQAAPLIGDALMVQQTEGKKWLAEQN